MTPPPSRSDTIASVQRQTHFYSDGFRLSGTVYLPDDLEPGERRPALVACSGYLGLNVIYPRLFAGPLTEAGYVVLGFDYRGSGESEGVPGRLIVEEQIRDIKHALTLVRVQDEVDRERITLIGWGMGAGSVIRVGAEDERVRGVAALNGFYNGRSFLLARHGEERFAELLERLEEDRVRRVLTGEGTFTDPYEIYPLDPDTHEEVRESLEPVPGFGEPTAFELVESLLGFDAEVVAHKIAPRPFFLAHGKWNRLHPLEDALSVYGRAGHPKTLYLIEGKHNDFMRADHPEFTALVEALVQWLEDRPGVPVLRA